MTGQRPTLAIVYGHGSAPAMSLSAAASSVCDIAWVVDASSITDASMLRLLRKLGTIVDIAGLSEEQAATAVKELRPQGIVAYADPQIATAAALGEILGLDYYDRAVSERLLDKVTQRKALGDRGLPVPHCMELPRHPTPEDVDALAAVVNFPAVLKPRHGAASRDTHLAADATQLRVLVAQLPDSGAGMDMVVEEFMADPSEHPSSWFGDYVSVESVVAAGRVSHLAVTGRLPGAKPFRETGLIIPSDYAPSLLDAILEVASESITALAIRTGCLHTEIKVTDAGPRVIEVNGRIGGFVAPVLALASPGVDFFEISQRVALGEPVNFEELVPTPEVGYVTVGQPPIGATRVVSVSGLDKVANYPGVDSVALNRRPGAEVDWRLGSHEYIYAVLGRAPDHDAVRAMQHFVDEEVEIVYE
jgi:biotin carboxylase